MLQVKLPDTMSKPAHVITRVPQGGFKPLFDIFINDIGETLPSNVVTYYIQMCRSLYQLVPTGSGSFLQDVVCLFESWASHNKMEQNAQMTKEMWIFSETTNSFLCHRYINDVRLEGVNKFKILSIEVQDNLKCNSHITSIMKKANKCISHVRACPQAGLSSEVGLTTYFTKTRPLLE